MESFSTCICLANRVYGCIYGYFFKQLLLFTRPERAFGGGYKPPPIIFTGGYLTTTYETTTKSPSLYGGG